MVSVGPSVVALCPFASQAPFHVQLLPRAERARFEDDGPTGADTLHDVSARGWRPWARPPPVWVRTAPPGATAFCWRIEIVPAAGPAGGLEAGAGVHLTRAGAGGGGGEAARRRACPLACAPMPPSPRPIPAFAAQTPQEPRPYGRWGQALTERFHEAARALESEEDLGEPGEVVWFPDRTWGGRTYVPATASTSTGFELFGYVSYTREHEGAQAEAFTASVDWTDETAEANPDWSLDLSDQEIGEWRGPDGQRGVITLVWGVSLVANGAVATAELGPATTDQCVLVDDRFTLVSLDDYVGDLLEIRLYGQKGAELARESLYEDD